MKPKPTPYIFILCLLALLLSGCGPAGGADAGTVADAQVRDNPFDYEGPPEVLGYVAHSGNWPEMEEGRPLEYTGGELEVPYRAEGEGTGKNVGFLLFLDGIPQPYRLNGEGEYGYIHPFTLGADGVEEHFTFNFLPVTGKIGDTVAFNVTNIFNAGFEPDMVSSSGFGLYGSALSTLNFIRFSADPGTGSLGAEPLSALSGVTVTNELMTAGFVEKNLGPQAGMTTGDGKTREDRLDDTVYVFDTYDGETELNDLDVTGRDTLHVAVDMCGVPGLRYRVALYADGVPLSDGERCFWEVTLEKGKAARVEADLDLGKLEAVTTFYVIACAVDGSEAGDLGLGLIKTGSLPIWSRDRADPGASPDGGDRAGSGTAAVVEAETPEAMDGAVRSLWYGGGDRVLVRKADGLVLVDMATGRVLAEGPVPDLTGVTYSPVDGGFCALGRAEAGGTVCVLLDSALAEAGRLSLSPPAGEDRNVMCAAVSPDGRYAAFSVMNDGIYLCSLDTGDVTLLLDLSAGSADKNGGVTMATGLWFDGDSSRVIFADSSHFGAVGLDGGGFTAAAIDGFEPQGPVGCAGGRVFFNESFFTASGAMAVADAEGLTSAVYRHSAQEGSGDLYVSRDGDYFATTAFDGSLTVRVYGTADDSLRLEYTVTDENQDVFAAAPEVLILDDMKLCLVKLGGFSDIPARVLVLSFE